MIFFKVLTLKKIRESEVATKYMVVVLEGSKRMGKDNLLWQHLIGAVNRCGIKIKLN